MAQTFDILHIFLKNPIRCFCYSFFGCAARLSIVIRLRFYLMSIHYLVVGRHYLTMHVLRIPIRAAQPLDQGRELSQALPIAFISASMSSLVFVSVTHIK